MLWGCPYEAPFPIDQPIVKMDTHLLGKWKPQHNAKGGDSIIITQKDAYKYMVSLYSSDHKGDDQGVAWLSKVNGVLFLNLESHEGSKVKYTFIALDKLSANSFSYRTISDEQKKTFKNSEELKNWIKADMNSKSFYEKGDVMMRFK
jgi:hypothetical protein